VDARINVLAECLRIGMSILDAGVNSNTAKKKIIGKETVPEPNMEELLYQSLIGAGDGK